MMTVNLREATVDDVAFLVSVHAAVNREKFAGKDEDAERFLTQVTAWAGDEVAGKVKDSVTYVIVTGGTSVGRLRVVRRSYELMIAGIQILPKHQGMGIGSGIIRSLIDEAEGKRLPVRLEVDRRDPDAKRLYLGLGFQVVEDRDRCELMEIPNE
jgi:GNAT superfamily N-acetyltransferase